MAKNRATAAEIVPRQAYAAVDFTSLVRERGRNLQPKTSEAK
jgi:hypothetical protein